MPEKWEAGRILATGNGGLDGCTSEQNIDIEKWSFLLMELDAMQVYSMKALRMEINTASLPSGRTMGTTVPQGLHF